MIKNNMIIDEPTSSQISWSAIFMGAFVGIGLGFLLQLFGSAIGLSVFTVHNGALTVAIGGMIGFLIMTLVSMFTAGYTAGYLGRNQGGSRSLGLMYGFVTWTFALLLSAMLMGFVQKYVSMYTQTLSHTGVVVTMADNSVTQHFSTSDHEVSSDNQDSTPKFSARDLAWAAYIAFVMFFMGAIAACIGSLYGLGVNLKGNSFRRE